MKIEAIFSDYDGTLCPLQVPREEAFIPPKLLHLLENVGRRIPIAVITTKDLGFVAERVPFAQAIAAIGGLELELGASRITDERIQSRAKILREAYEEATRIIGPRDEIFLERKTTSEGVLVSFCLDWRLAHDRAEAWLNVRPILARFRDVGLYVVEREWEPFADVFVTEVNKGTAFARLKKELKLNGPIMYLGDSEMDNSAFELADVSVAIEHEESSVPLHAKYSLRFENLPRFIANLLATDFNFSPRMVTGRST